MFDVRCYIGKLSCNSERNFISFECNQYFTSRGMLLVNNRYLIELIRKIFSTSFFDLSRNRSVLRVRIESRFPVMFEREIFYTTVNGARLTLT